MIHVIIEHDVEHFVISSHDVWLPGAYDSKRAARYAFKFDYKELLELQNAQRGELITFDDLKNYREHSKKLGLA